MFCNLHLRLLWISRSNQSFMLKVLTDPESEECPKLWNIGDIFGAPVKPAAVSLREAGGALRGTLGLCSVHPQLTWLSCFSMAEGTKRDRETFAESYCSSIKQTTKFFSVSLEAFEQHYVGRMRRAMTWCRRVPVRRHFGACIITNLYTPHKNGPVQNA